MSTARLRSNRLVDVGTATGFVENSWIGQTLAIGPDLVISIREPMVRDGRSRPARASTGPPALVAARTETGSGFEAFRRACGELIDRLEILMWWMLDAASAISDGSVSDASDARVAAAEVDGQPVPDASDPRIAALMARGRADGSIDPTVNVEWAEQLLWASLYAAAHAAVMTSMTGFEARSQAPRSLL